LLATLVAQRGRVDEALRLCETAESILPNLDVAQMSVAVLRQVTPSRAQIDRVKTRLRKWVEADPRSTVLMNYLANASELEENYDEASDLYAQVLKIDPQDVWALNNLAFLAALHQTQGDLGLQLISRAIRIAGPVANLLDTRAAIYLVLNDPKHAIRDLNTALNEKAEVASYIRLVQAHLAGNNKRAAREAFQKAKELMNSASNLHALDAASYRALSRQFN
jgi:tetratricopeptide (TPR) repeat protein